MRSFLLLALVLASFCVAQTSADPASWPSWGADIHNTRNVKSPIKPQNVEHLQLKRFFNTSAGVSGSPTTNGNKLLYFTDSAGLLHCQQRHSYETIWTYNVTRFLLTKGVFTNHYLSAISRSAPFVTDEHVYIGTLGGSFVMKFDAFTGKLIWETKLTSHPFAEITSSLSLFGNQIFVGLSSVEEQVVAGETQDGVSTYNGTFRGSVSSLDTKTGLIQWTTYMVPEGFTGGAVWGSQFPVDEKTNQVFIATGNAYDVPASVEACMNETRAENKTMQYPDPCRVVGDMSEAVVSLDRTTGAVNWAFSNSPVEAYTLACGIKLPRLGYEYLRNVAICSQTPGQDADFGQSPIFLAGRKGVTPKGRDVVITGQKGGFVWALDALNGQLLWSVAAGPSGGGGGIMFGSTTNGTHYFYANANSESHIDTLIDGTTTSLGHVGAINILTGAIVWQKPFLCYLYAALTHSNGLLYVPCGQMAGTPAGGQFHILDASNGEVLFERVGIPNTGTRAAGISVVGDQIYVPIGYNSPSAGGVFVYALP